MLRLPLRRQSALFHVLRRQTRPHNLRRNASTTNTRSTIVDRSRSWFWTYATYATYATSTFVFFHIFWTYFYTLSSTYGVSMMPTIQSYDWVLISKYYRRGRDLGIGDIVSFKNPVDGSTAVKRIVGMPGDFVLRDSPGKNDLMIQVPEGHCWLVGDNLTYSRDSRMFGAVPLALVLGKVLCGIRSGYIMTTWQGLEPAVLDDDLD